MMCKKQLSLDSWKRERKSDGQKVISAHMLLWGENSGVSYAVFEYKKKCLVKLGTSILKFLF